MVALAVADALRGRDEAAEEPPPATAEPEPVPEPPRPNPGLVALLRAERIQGRLLVADGRCRVVALELPELVATERAGASCSLRPPGDATLPAGLTEADLRRTGVPQPRVVARAALSPTRDALLLPWPGSGYVVAIYEGRELVASHRFDSEGEGRLDAAPGGSLFVVPPARIFRADGAPVRLAPRFRNARAVAWSPDGRWVALAMVGATVVVPTQGLVGGSDVQRAIRLPYPARDVAWEGG